MKLQPRPTLVLDRHQRRLHRDTCSHVERNPTDYHPHFAEHGSRDVALAVVDLDLKPCRTCRPLQALAWWEHQQRKHAREQP